MGGSGGGSRRGQSFGQELDCETNAGLRTRREEGARMKAGEGGGFWGGCDTRPMLAARTTDCLHAFLSALRRIVV